MKSENRLYNPNWNVQPSIKADITPVNFNISFEFSHTPQGKQTFKADTRSGFEATFQLKMQNVYERGGNCFDVTIKGIGDGIDFEETGKLIKDMMKAYRDRISGYTQQKRADYILLQSLKEKATEAIKAGHAVQIFYRINSVEKHPYTAYCRNLKDLESITAKLTNGIYGTERSDSKECDYWHLAGMKII